MSRKKAVNGFLNSSNRHPKHPPPPPLLLLDPLPSPSSVPSSTTQTQLTHLTTLLKTHLKKDPTTITPQDLIHFFKSRVRHNPILSHLDFHFFRFVATFDSFRHDHSTFDYMARSLISSNRLDSLASLLQFIVANPCPCSDESEVLFEEKMQNANSSTEEEKLRVRKLEISDNNKGFIELLQQHTICDSVSNERFQERFQELAKYGDDHLVCVIEDDKSRKIVATGSVFVEKKFIRNCGKVGHIEDIVVDSSVRGKQLGKKIIEFLSDHAQSTGCYKVILDCSIDNRPFYEKCGFKQKEVQMVKYFN